MKKKLFIIFLTLVIFMIILLNIPMYQDLKKINSILNSKENIENSNLKIALIHRDNGNFTKQLSSGAKDQANQESIFLKEYITEPAGHFNISEYMNLVIMADYNGIIVDAENPEIAPVISRAIEHNIPVITIISDLPDSDRISYVGVNNHRVGFIIGRTILEEFKNKEIKLAIISKNYDNENTPAAEYLKIFGFMEAISSRPEASILTWKKVESNIVKETEAIIEVLKTYPDTNCIFTTNISASRSAANLKSKIKENDFFLIGYGIDRELNKYLAEGILNACVYINPEDIGSNAVKELTTYIKDKKTNLYSNINIKMFKTGRGITEQEF